MVLDDALPSVSNIGPYLIVVCESLRRGLRIKNYLFAGAICAINFSARYCVLPEPVGEGRLGCELINLLHYFVPKMVSERNVSLDGRPNEQPTS